MENNDGKEQLHDDKRCIKGGNGRERIKSFNERKREKKVALLEMKLDI